MILNPRRTTGCTRTPRASSASTSSSRSSSAAFQRSSRSLGCSAMLWQRNCSSGVQGADTVSLHFMNVHSQPTCLWSHLQTSVSFLYRYPTGELAQKFCTRSMLAFRGPGRPTRRRSVHRCLESPAPPGKALAESHHSGGHSLHPTRLERTQLESPEMHIAALYVPLIRALHPTPLQVTGIASAIVYSILFFLFIISYS